MSDSKRDPPSRRRRLGPFERDREEAERLRERIGGLEDQGGHHGLDRKGRDRLEDDRERLSELEERGHGDTRG